MDIKQRFFLKSSIMKSHVNKYALWGLSLAIGSIILATCIVSYQLTGYITLTGLIKAQASNPALWALDITPFIFAYWGQSFFYELASKAETIIDDTTRKYMHKSDHLELKLKHKDIHDSLTNLPNYILLTQRISNAIEQNKNNHELVLIVIAINNFRTINHTIGSFSANSLLVQFAEKLKPLILRPYMLENNMGMNMVARLQGAEFAILIPMIGQDHDLPRIINNIILETSGNFMVDGHYINVKTTAGIARYPQNGKTAKKLIQHASLALLFAENENKPYAMYQAKMAKHYKSERLVAKELKSAMEKKAFNILYKPVIHLGRNKIVGAEAAIHFNNEKYGTITPEKLLAITGGSLLTEGLTFCTLKNVISQMAKWHPTNPDFFVRVYLYEAIDPALPTILQKLLEENNIPAQALHIELTEQACLSDQKRTLHVLNRLDELGVNIAISDFGSGYSSFVYLTNFPIKEIKIDKTFISLMLTDEKKHSLVQAIIKLAEAMDLAVVADGVDSAAIKTALETLGCTYGQGTFYADFSDADSFYKAYKKSAPAIEAITSSKHR